MEEPRQTYTNQQLLVKGLKKMAFALPLLFLSPYLITLSFLNKETAMFYVFLIGGIFTGGLAIFLCFKGIQTIIKAIFH